MPDLVLREVVDVPRIPCLGSPEQRQRVPAPGSAPLALADREPGVTDRSLPIPGCEVGRRAEGVITLPAPPPSLDEALPLVTVPERAAPSPGVVWICETRFLI